MNDVLQKLVQEHLNTKYVRQLRVKKLHPDAILPTKAHPHDGGLDLYAIDDYVIRPGDTVKVKTGISIELPQGKNIGVGLLWDRSGLGSKGIHRLAGVIDQDYRGEIVVCLTNLNIWPLLNMIIANGCKASSIYETNYYEFNYYINRGDKVIQMLIQEVTPVEVIEVEELQDTKRGSSRFGSSG